MWTTGIWLLLHAVFMLGLTAMIVLFRGEHTDMLVLTRGAQSLQLVCYLMIIAGALLVRFGTPPPDAWD